MRHWSVQVGAILIGVLCSTRSLAADAADCTDCSVANAIASALQEDDRSRSGVRIGDSHWLLSVSIRDLETCWLDASSHTLTGEADQDFESLLEARAIEEPGNPIGEYVGAGVAFESAVVADWRLQFGVAIGFAEQLISNPGMDAARDSSWTIGLRFEFSR